MRTFYFNTGVRPYIHNPPVKIHHGQVLRGGTVQIPFDCDNVPENAIFKFACDNPNLPESKSPHYIVREMVNTTMVSKYAYFQLIAI